MMLGKLGGAARIFALALLISAPFMLAGCLFSVPTEEQLGQTGVQVPQYNNQVDYVCTEPNDGKPPCWCMFCQQGVAWYNNVPLLSSWFDSTLYGGGCSFEYCDQEIYENILKTSSTSVPKAVMLGAGPSFVSTDAANRYCKFSLQIATKWLKPTAEGLPPRPPMRSRAQCWLERNTFPLYIYYGGTPNIDLPATTAIAQRLDEGSTLGVSHLGPAMITTEATFVGTDLAMAQKVRQQIQIIRSSCPNCFLILAVQSGDSEALRQIFRDPANPSQFSPEYTMVDAVGFGFRANDYLECSVEKIIGKNYLFSREILREYSKPTIWLYAGASEGNNIDGSCTWDALAVHRFYENMFALTQGMASSGIIGANFYEWRDKSGPLPCNDIQGCEFGFLKPNGDQKHPELNTWSSLCQYFGAGKEDDPESTFRSPLIFSRNSYGLACDFLQNNKMFDIVSLEVNDPGALKYDEVVPEDKVDHLGCGEICPSETSFPNENIYDDQPGFSSFNSDHCDAYPIIDELADELEISGIYYRAMVEQESDFDPLVASCVDSSNSNCNVAGTSLSQMCADAGMTGCHTLTGAADCPAGKKPCGLGLSQCIDPPGDPTYTAKCGGGQPYNPFDPGMSLCCGMNKFSDYRRQAENWVKDTSHWFTLTKCLPDGIKQEEADWLIYYLASNRYNGADSFSDSLFSSFKSQLDQNGECTGKQHYVTWLQGLSQTVNKDNRYGAQIMTRYREAVDQCDSDCPN